MRSFFHSVFDSPEPLSLEASVTVKQEPASFFDFLVSFSDPDLPEVPMFCPGLDDIHSVDSSTSSVSPLLTPPAHRPVSLASPIAHIKQEPEDAFSAPGSLYSDFLGAYEVPDADLSVLHALGRRNASVKPSASSALDASTLQMTHTPQSRPQYASTHYSRQRHRKLLALSMPNVSPHPQQDVNDEIDCPDATEMFLGSWKRVFRLYDWTLPEDRKHSFVDLDLRGWIPRQVLAPKLEPVSIRAQAGSREREAVQEIPGDEKVAVDQNRDHSRALEAKSMAERARNMASLSKSTKSAISDTLSTKPHKLPKIKWARRNASNQPTTRRKRHTTPSAGRLAAKTVPPATSVDVKNLLVSATLSEPRPPLPAFSSNLVPQGPYTPADAEKPASSLRRPLRCLSAHKTSASFSSRSHPQPPHEETRQQQDPTTLHPPGKPRLRALLSPSLARSITQSARARAAEESLGVRRRLEEDMHRIQEDEEREEARKLADEFLDLGPGRGEEAGAKKEEDGRGDCPTGESATCKESGAYGAAFMLSVPTSYSASTRRRALGRCDSYPGAPRARRGPACAARPEPADADPASADRPRDFPALLSKSLCRTLSEGPLASREDETGGLEGSLAKRRLGEDEAAASSTATAKRVRTA